MGAMLVAHSELPIYETLPHFPDFAVDTPCLLSILCRCLPPDWVHACRIIENFAVGLQTMPFSGNPQTLAW